MKSKVKSTLKLKDRVGKSKYAKHISKLNAHRDANGVYHKKKVSK